MLAMVIDLDCQGGNCSAISQQRWGRCVSEAWAISEGISQNCNAM